MKIFYLSVLMVLISVTCLDHLFAQDVPTAQGAIFRNLWVGEQVDSLPKAGTLPPGGLGAIMGSLQTTDDVQHEVEVALAGVNTPPAVAIKPYLSVGWQFSTQPTQLQSSSGSSQSGNVNSAYLAPSVSVLYSRSHGPWDIAVGYSIGLLYYSNPNFVSNGNDASVSLFQSAFIKTYLETTRYTFSAFCSASSGTGYDVTSASSNQQTDVDAKIDFKYFLNKYANLDATAGYSLLNFANSTATPNNNLASFYAALASIYDLSDRSHFKFCLGAGQTGQSLQQGTAVSGNTPLSTSQSAAMNYAQFLGDLKYDITSKITADGGVGFRYVSTSDISNANNSYTGLRPAWTLGLAYTPTDKTSVTLSTGEQGNDVRPEFNFLVCWKPRNNTKVSIGLTQYENFANSLLNQYTVTQSLVGTVSQTYFSKLKCELSAGYASQQYINLSNEEIAGQSNSQLPSNYYFARASVLWRISKRMNLDNTFYINTGQLQSGPNNNSASRPVAWYSISLNFEL